MNMTNHPQHDLLKSIASKLTQPSNTEAWQQDRLAHVLLGVGDPELDEVVRNFVQTPQANIPYFYESLWKDFDHLLSLPPLERCNFIMEHGGSVHGFAFLEPTAEELPQMIQDLVSRHKRIDREGIVHTDQYLLTALWTLRQQNSSAIELLEGVEAHSWIEKREMFLIRKRANAPVDAPTCVTEPCCPTWLSDIHPAFSRDRLTGALQKGMLASDPKILHGLEPFTPREELPESWVIYLDVDHMGKHNQQYGYTVGDSILSELISHLQTFVGDRVFRIGGEEFLVLFNDPDGLSFAKKIKQSIEKLDFERAENLHITVSMGLATGDTFAEGLLLAEEGMWDAKHQGRNCVILRS